MTKICCCCLSWKKFETEHDVSNTLAILFIFFLSTKHLVQMRHTGTQHRNHRCPRVENLGMVVMVFSPKIMGKGSMILWKFSSVVHFWGFIAFLLTSFLKQILGVVLLNNPSPCLILPLCASAQRTNPIRS